MREQYKQIEELKFMTNLHYEKMRERGFSPGEITIINIMCSLNHYAQEKGPAGPTVILTSCLSAVMSGKEIDITKINGFKGAKFKHIKNSNKSSNQKNENKTNAPSSYDSKAELESANQPKKIPQKHGNIIYLNRSSNKSAKGCIEVPEQKIKKKYSGILNHFSQEEVTEVICAWLFSSDKSHRYIDDNILRLNSNFTHGFKSWQILHTFGLDRKFKGLFGEYSLLETIDILSNDKQNFRQIISYLNTK